MSRIPLAFMSYVNDDDKYANGKITKFREHLSRAVKAHRGKPFEIFQDKDDIKWGQQWKERINDALDATLFLIPIITPSFFNSKACREELERFLKREKVLGRNNLILPVYYIECPVLSDKAKQEHDKLVQTIADRQYPDYADWRELRHHSFNTRKVSKALTKMAQQIVEALERSEAEASRLRPENKPQPVSSVNVPEGLQLVIQSDQIEIVFDMLKEQILDILGVFVSMIVVICIFTLGAWTVQPVIIGCAMLFATIANVIWKSTVIPLVRIKRECLHILRRTPFGETRGNRLHTNVIKNVRVVDSEVVVETDARKYTIGLGLNRDALEWLKNCILSEANVQRRGNKE